jgi:hypothetical protein
MNARDSLRMTLSCPSQVPWPTLVGSDNSTEEKVALYAWHLGPGGQG